MRQHRPFLLTAFASIAVAFGIGRYGIGLFLPDMAREFKLTDADLGYMASAGWAGYVAASVVAMLAISSVGARALVTAGLLLSVAGMGLIAEASNSVMLLGGAILTGVSPGLVFAPLADAITANFEPERRGPAFAIVNSGEGAGAVAAGILFYFYSGNWRTAWLAFCGLAIATLAAAALSVPRGSVKQGGAYDLRPSWRVLVQRAAWPLLFGSFVAGISTTVLWTYAAVVVDGVTLAGFELRVVLWIAMGLAGVAAIVVAPILEAYGLRRTYAASVVLTSLSALALALAAHTPVAALIAATVFGFAYIMITSQIGGWALAIWPEIPAAGFGLTFLVFSFGAVVGPAAAGLATSAFSLRATLVMTGALSVILLAVLPRRS